jgi:hypothetical protein
MNIFQIHNYIAKFSPINGVNFPDEENRSSWYIDFSPTATVEQRAAANAAFAALDLDNVPLTPLEQINVLEAKVTPRRQREALLTDAGKVWLADIDAQIAVLRAQL